MTRLGFSHYVPLDPIADRLEGFSLIQPPQNPGTFSEEQLHEVLGSVDGFVCMADTPFTVREFEAAKNLRFLGNLGSGFNNIDVTEASRRGIPVLNTPSAVVNPTAELTMTLLLGVCRGLVRYDRTLRTDGICPRELLSYKDMTLSGKVLGIVGYGRIGKRVAELAQAFGMRIIVCDSHHSGSLSLDEVLMQADVVSLHLPYRAQNHHLIDARALSLMKRSAYLLNVARGPIVDEQALVQALKDGVIRAAALDVHEFEPAVSERIRALANVVITPHISTNLAEARYAMLTELIEGMHSIVDAQGLPANTVNKKELTQ